MTEDHSQCDVITKRDYYAAHGISGVDSERRNYCWSRVAAGEIDERAGCEVFASWPDGRVESRECQVLK